MLCARFPKCDILDLVEHNKQFLTNRFTYCIHILLKKLRGILFCKVSLVNRTFYTTPFTNFIDNKEERSIPPSDIKRRILTINVDSYEALCFTLSKYIVYYRCFSCFSKAKETIILPTAMLADDLRDYFISTEEKSVFFQRLRIIEKIS